MADVAGTDAPGAIAADAAVDASPPAPATASEPRPPAAGEAADQPDSEDGVEAETAGDEDELPACKLRRQYYCKSCSYQTSNPREYLYHQKDVHGAKIQINKCPHCVYASKCKIKLNRHMQMVHSGDPTAKPVEMTGKIMVRSSAELLQGGGGGEVEEVTDDIELAEQMGDEVQEAPARETRPVRHVVPKVSYDPYQETKTTKDLKKKFYRCKKCQYLTNVKSRFTKHVKYHSMPMIKCELCEFRTPYKWNLDRHMKNHTGNGEFKCNQCSFSAHIKQSLTVHIQNHHLPPEEVLNKIRAKGNVGGSDVIDDDMYAGMDLDEEELLRLEREEESEEDEVVMVKEPTPTKPKVSVTARKSLPESRPSVKPSGERHDFENDFVHPDNIVERNGRAYLKECPCSVCSYKAINEKELQRHEYTQHGVVRNGQIPPVYTSQRPVVSRPSFTPAATVPSSVGQKTKPTRPPPSLIPIPAVSGSGEDEIASEHGSSSDGTEQVDTTVSPGAVEMAQRAERAAEEFLSATTDGAGTGSVLDRLFNQKMAAANGGSGDAVKSAASESTSAPAPTTTAVAAGGAAVSRASSTRCQFCRHRCKTTDDLRAHEKTCPSRESAPAATTQPPAATDTGDQADKKVFIWNTAGDKEKAKSKQKNTTVTETDDIKSIREESHDNDEEMVSQTTTRSRGPAEEGDVKMVTKRVFKCPECTFWATTASRFHVHLVGHMNMKPYECSECGYRSNWRWDITKHIKLKSAKDRSHTRAKLFINDGGSTRDYDKYDIYLQYMEVEEGLQCKPQISSSTRRRRGTSSSPVAAMMRPLPPPPMPLRPGLGVPPNVTISTSMYGGVPMYEPTLIGSPPLARLPLPMPMPMPPRLTRAPTAPLGALRPPMVNIPAPLRGMMLPPPPRPPPPSLESLKRMDPTLAAMGITDENTAIVMPESPEDATVVPASGQTAMSAPAEPPAADGKKPTVWRCKKCNFKSPDRELVKAHYRSHGAPFACGLCGQTSKWKHVLLRHCRMKHDGVISVIENNTDVSRPQVTSQPSSDVTISVVSKHGENAGGGGASFRCDICSYTCANSDEAIAAHMQHHTPQPGASFKCLYCPFYVADKKSLNDHVVLHGITSSITSSIQLPARKFPGDGPAGFPSPQQAASEQTQVDFIQVGPAEPQSPNKPYKCSHCPYSSDQRVLFLQHRQMHVPRGQPFRCPACTFSTSQRGVLIGHARLHGMQPRDVPPAPSAAPAPVPAQAAAAGGEKPRRALMKPERSTIGGPTLKDSETRNLEEVPLVWVSRGGKFFKMFKCRQCPHVNLRKSNIQDHEKMHTDRDLAGYAHRCTKCNYVCINAGVLSGHLKVHTYWLGKIHAIVDMKRSDEEELREILGEDYANDVEVVADKTLTSQPPALGGGPGLTAPVAASAPESNPSDPQRILYFCQHCPARFFHDNEIKIHSRFHGMNLPFTCQQCSYTARQHPHLLAHLKVHSDEYRERTRSLLAIYTCSPDHPPRGTTPAPPTSQTSSNSGVPAVKKPLPPGIPKPAVTVGLGMPSSNTPSVGSSPSSVDGAMRMLKVKRCRCHLCPARFVKEATLRYHQSLHGSSGPFRCTRCNYAVKTYGNLVQHINLHSEADQKAAQRGAPSDLVRARVRADDFPMSGVDLLKRKLDFEKEFAGEMPSKKVMRFAPPSMMDPSSPYYAERTGNPDFAYPTVLDKYGREREKRYKCQKCPSAFEKREQYMKHISLHSAQSRYTCTVCDYSVKYYPNFCNHMKRHGMRPPPMEEAANAAISAADSRSTSPAVDAEGVRIPARANYTGAPELTAVERQQIVLQRVREEQETLKEEEPTKKVHWCELCPYANTRRGTTEDHRWRHRFYGSRGGCGCRFCDYACQQSHLLKEHHKLHFRACKYVKVDSYTQLVGLEIFIKEVPDGEDKENMEEPFSTVDVSDHDVLFRASDVDAADTSGPKVTDPTLLVDISTGELLSEKPDNPQAEEKAETNGVKDEVNGEAKEVDGQEGDGGKEKIEKEEEAEEEKAKEEMMRSKSEEEEEETNEGKGESNGDANKDDVTQQENESGSPMSEASDDQEKENGPTVEETPLDATPPDVIASTENADDTADVDIEFEIPEDDGEAAAAVLALQAAEMQADESDPPVLTMDQSEPPELDDDESEPPELTNDQSEPPELSNDQSEPQKEIMDQSESTEATTD